MLHSEKYSMDLELVIPEAAKIIIQGFVISKFNHCNGFLFGVSGHQLNKLQIVQNIGCRIIKNLREICNERSTPVENSTVYSIQSYSYNLPMCQYCSSTICSTSLLDLKLTSEDIRSNTHGNFQYQGAVLHKYVTVQSNDSGMNYHNR